jgi:hypothetical protein
MDYAQALFMKHALKKMPSDELSRRTFLSSLFDPDDKARAEQIGDKFRSIKDSKIRRELLDRLNSA